MADDRLEESPVQPAKAVRDRLVESDTCRSTWASAFSGLTFLTIVPLSQLIRVLAIVDNLSARSRLTRTDLSSGAE